MGIFEDLKGFLGFLVGLCGGGKNPPVGHGCGFQDFKALPGRLKRGAVEGF